VVLCKASDNTTEPNPPAYFANMLINRGTNGVADYYYDQSGGKLNISTGSVVKGWYTTSKTQAQIKAIPSRWGKVSFCIDAARAAGYNPPANHRLVAVYNVDVGDAGTQNGVLMAPGVFSTGFAAHEMGHTMGLDHSWSNDTSYRNATWSGPGEYDNPWDEMSAMNIYGRPGVPYATAAVGLNAFQRDRLGWIPTSRVTTFGSGGPASGSVTIGRLDNLNPSLSAPALVRVPISAADPTHYYTIEYRKKAGWDSGIPADIVMINEIKNNTPYLIRQLGTPDRAPVQTLNANGVKISVNWASGDNASVSITTTSAAVGVYGPNTCKNGYVWREADRNDYVCVTPATRTQARNDNSAAGGRHVPGSTYCVNGYVWREAFAGDYVCVVPSVRSQTWDDNNRRWDRVA
jgi:hypothetical protein